MKASDLFVAALEAEGVEYVFGLPGEENLDLLDSLSRSGIRVILTRHEQGAGFMAATYGRHTGEPGVCLATLGPGAANLVTAAAYATLGGMPMLMITGQKPVKTSKQGQFQIVDIVDMMQPLTKYTQSLVSGDGIPSRVREAFRIATEEKPGAVHLELPEDVATEDSDADPMTAGRARRPTAEEKSIKLAVELLESATSPLLLIGAAANRKLTSRMLNRFVDATGIPFISTQMGKGVIDERHPKFLGNTALSSGDFVHRAVDAADLIINVGHDVVEKPPFIMEPGGVQVIHVNFFRAAVDPVYFPQVEVVGDIANAVWQLAAQVRVPDRWDFSFFDRVKAAADRHIESSADDPRFPVHPNRLVHAVRAVMPDDGIICLDNGIYKIWFARNYRAHAPNTVLLDNALASMGAGLPSALASKLIFPDRRVMAICGDGGFLMNSQEMETAVRLGLDVTVLILRDDAYGMIKWKQQAMGLADYGLDFGNPDFVAYAEAYGAHGHRVEQAGDLETVLEASLAEPGVHLVDCPIDYSENNRILNDEIERLAAEL